MLCILQGEGTTQGTRIASRGTAQGHPPESAPLEGNQTYFICLEQGQRQGLAEQVAQAGLQLLGLQVCWPRPSQRGKTLCWVLLHVSVLTQS